MFYIFVIVCCAIIDSRSLYVYLILAYLNLEAFLEACHDMKLTLTPSLTPAETIAFQMFTGVTDYQRMNINRFFRFYTNGTNTNQK